MVKVQHKDLIITTLKAGAKYHINFTQSGQKFVLNLHYNGSNSFLYVDAVEIYQFKAQDSEIKLYLLCLVLSKRFYT